MLVSDIVIDSRKCKADSLFIAYQGTMQDSHEFIESAINNGASVIVLDNPEYLGLFDVTYVQVENTQQVISKIAANFYDHPSAKLKIVGVTGTNGKTTTTDLLHKLFFRLGYKSGLVSTIKVSFGSYQQSAKLTTPDAISLQRLFKDMFDDGVTHVFMEVSSHAIVQGRVDNIAFDHLVFTNLSHDHLDYHKTFKEYLQAKKIIFDRLPKGCSVLTNIDDPNGLVMVQNCEAEIETYALRRTADFKGKIISNELSGLHLSINGEEVYLRLAGEFNAYNALAVYGTAKALDCEMNEVLRELSSLLPAEGRLQIVRSERVAYTAVVDYAHTPDALEKVLKTLVKTKTVTSKLITVVGCGGDRDKLKRPIMAKVAELYSDIVLLTSDNPRTEDPNEILEDMLKGLTNENEVIKIVDRRQAIKTACLMASEGDVILIAGKGHENYQDINGEKFPFDDKKIVESFMT